VTKRRSLKTKQSKRVPSRPSRGEVRDEFEAIVELVRQLEELKARARTLGMFTDDRELLRCPKCGLIEDVLCGGLLVTYHEEGDRKDTGLRFAESGTEGCFTCPECGAEALENWTPPPKPAGPAIAELRRIGGLTWDQLAHLFGVSRRSVHLWASGKPMAPSIEEHLQRVLAVIRKIDCGSPSANRTAVLGVREVGGIPFELLVAGDYERALELLGRDGPQRVAPPKVSHKARATRSSRPPEELAGALQDRIHPTSGRLLAAKPIATARRK